ncbi:MAG: pyridine nucleotide-disulfide oxidoreductase [Spirochaetes bacterium]|nr:MAG: pyridine nucleotide-disulfide oxidoreductase [Spirochaetota bacterium]
MKTSKIDLAIIGAGPAGLAAAVRAKELGIKDLVIFERDERPGGILNQCIHNGFGLVRFKEDLTGPEYAHRFIKEAKSLNVDIELNTMVLEMTKDKEITLVNEKDRIKKYKCKSIILSMGCRERTRGAIAIPGTRPAGIFTAGKAQRLINIEGYAPGKKVVILGSGDIGMIMARRLTLEGIEVKAVVEILPYTSGLLRNEIQCLRDFNIPLLLGHTVSEIHGDKRVEGVTVVKVDDNGDYLLDTKQYFECDTLLLSVGLIPENELSMMANIPIDSYTRGPYVNDYLETDVEGIFACGNVLHVNDLVDTVSKEGEIAAEGAANRIKGKFPRVDKTILLKKGENIAQFVPQKLTMKKSTTLLIRVKTPTGEMKLSIDGIYKKRFPYARPSEIIELKIPEKEFQNKNILSSELKIDCQESKNGDSMHSLS